MLEKNLFLRLVRLWHSLLLGLFRASIRRPILVLSLFFSGLLVSFLPLGQLRMLISIDDLVDPDFKTYQQLKALSQDFLDQDEIFLVVRTQSGRFLDKSELCAVRGWIQTVADTRGDINAIVSTFGILWPSETSDSFTIHPHLDPDCTILDLNEDEAIERGRQAVAASPWRGSLTSDAGDDVGVLIYPAARTEESFFGTFDHKIIDELQASFEQEVLSRHSKLKGAWVGDGVFQYHLRKGYEFMPILNLLMSLFIIVFLRIYHGTFLSSFLFLSVVTWISIPVYAGMALFGHPIDVLSSALSLMIFVSSIEDFLFVSFLRRNFSSRGAFRRLLLPSFFTSLTTVIGFGSLMFADLEIIRRFGLWAAVSAILEWIVMFIVLPTLLERFPRLQTWVNESKAKVVNQTQWVSFSPKRWISLMALIVLPLGVFATQRLHVSDSPERLLSASHPARQDLDVIENTRGWRAQVSLVFADHENRDFNQAVIDKVSDWPLVDQVESLYRIQDYFNQELSSSMQDHMNNLMRNNTLGHRLGPVVNQSRAVLYVKNLDIVDINKMRKQVKDLCPNEECWLAGTLVSYGELGGRVLSTLYKSLGGSLVLVSLVILFLCLAFRPNSFFPLILSAMWGPMALLCVFYLFDLPVFYITSMVASILVGVAGDNAIQFLFFSRKSGGLNQSVNAMAPASTLTLMAMVLASSVFFFGYFAPMKTLGAMMIGGLILSFIGDIWVLKGLLPRSSRDSE